MRSDAFPTIFYPEAEADVPEVSFSAKVNQKLGKSRNGGQR